MYLPDDPFWRGARRVVHSESVRQWVAEYMWGFDGDAMRETVHGPFEIHMIPSSLQGQVTEAMRNA